MAIEDVLKELIAERNKLDAAIKALQGTAMVSGAKRGRKPGKKIVAVKATRKRTVSPSARKKMAAAAKARWAAKKAASKA